MSLQNASFLKKFPILKILPVLLLIFLVYLPSLNNQFLNWDDGWLITENPKVRSLGFENIKKIFLETEKNIYVPLTVFSFALEYHFFKYNPFYYHLDNLLLHLGVVWLIFILGVRLGLNSRSSIIAALIFGLHPMHVESVAWVTERKDVLYSIFYLLAVLSYCQYLSLKKRIYYFLSLSAALMSVLAKPMALSLPLILWVIDWFHRRPIDKKIFLDKFPYFLVILPVVWVTFTANTNVVQGNWGEVILTSVWAFIFYIVKFCFPVDLMPIYPIPDQINIGNGYFLFSLFIFVFFVFFVIRFRSQRLFFFSVLWYVFSIFLVSRFNPRLNVMITADRFMYLPSLGFCFLLSFYIDRGLDSFKTERMRIIFRFLMCVLLIWSIFKTQVQIKIWNNSLDFWNYVIPRTNPHPHFYHNRGRAYRDAGKIELALKDYDEALRINPREIDVYFSKALLFENTGHPELAKQNYSEIIKIDPLNEKAYLNRSLIYLSSQAYDAANKDINKILEINPKNPDAYNNLAVIYFQQKMYPLAVENFTKSLEINPCHVDALNNRGGLLAMIGQYDLAKKDFDQALKCDKWNVRTITNIKQLETDRRKVVK